MLRKTSLILASLTALAASAMAVTVVPPPTVSLTVGGNLALSATPASVSGPTGVWSINNLNLTNPGYSFTGSISGAEDPQFTFAFGFSNTGTAAQLFTVSLSQPYFGGPYTNAFSSLAGTYTDGGNGVIAINSGTAGLNIDQPQIDGVNVGGIAGGCGGIVVPNSSGACGSTNIPSIPVSTFAGGTMSVTLTISLSAGDSYSVTGNFGMNNPATTPEPSTLAMFGSGAALLLVGLRRRR